jgi:hypothetical protein
VVPEEPQTGGEAERHLPVVSIECTLHCRTQVLVFTVQPLEPDALDRVAEVRLRFLGQRRVIAQVLGSAARHDGALGESFVGVLTQGFKQSISQRAILLVSPSVRGIL